MYDYILDSEWHTDADTWNRTVEPSRPWLRNCKYCGRPVTEP